MQRGKNGRWTHIFHFPFTMKNEKWTPNFIFHYRKWKMENVYPFSIFHFPFAMENTKWATEKLTKTPTHILGRWHDYC